MYHVTFQPPLVDYMSTKIRYIKAWRVAHGSGLKTAKEVIEDGILVAEDDLPQILRDLAKCRTDEGHGLAFTVTEWTPRKFPVPFVDRLS